MPPSTRVCAFGEAYAGQAAGLRDFALPVRSWHSQPGYSADLRYWTRWQLPKFRQVPTSVHVAWTPSRVQLQPNCPHHACWLLAIWRYASDVVLTRVAGVAQADNSAQRITVASNPLFAFMMGTFLIKNELENAGFRFKADDHSNIYHLPSLRLRSSDPILVQSSRRFAPVNQPRRDRQSRR